MAERFSIIRGATGDVHNNEYLAEAYRRKYRVPKYSTYVTAVRSIGDDE